MSVDNDKLLEDRLFEVMGEAVDRIAAEVVAEVKLNDPVYLQVVRKRLRVMAAAVSSAAERIVRAYTLALKLVSDGATRELNNMGAYQDGDN